MNKYYVFCELMKFVSDEYEVTDADMSNYCGDIEIHGMDEAGATITIKVTMKEAENNGN